MQPLPGDLLISDPFLKDPNFMRTVVFICEHSKEGGIGLVLNRLFDQELQSFIPELAGQRIPLYYGGPVQPDTLHFLHNIPALMPGAQQVLKDVYWGGDFEIVIKLLKEASLDLQQIRFFLGYSGWGEGQLTEELADKSWLTIQGSHQLVFDTAIGAIWKSAVLQLDASFHPIVNYPLDPQLN